MSERSMTPEDERLAAAIALDIEERDRAKGLTNEQLVDEILELMPFISAREDALIEEMCERLDPTWQARADAAGSKPLSPEDEEIVQRLSEKAVAKMRETPK